MLFWIIVIIIGGWLLLDRSLLGAVASILICVAVYVIFAWNTKRIAARNAVYAALTYRHLDILTRAAVDERSVSICRRMGVRVESLGPAFPMGGSTGADGLCEPADVYALRSLAMHELGIPPLGATIERWYLLRTPFGTRFAKRHLAKFRRQVEEKYDLSLSELDA